MSLATRLRSIGSVAKKELLHILRDWRILILIFTLPPAFTLLFGYAFEEGATTNAPSLLHDADHTPESRKLIERLRESKTFAWREWSGSDGAVDLLGARARAALTIPPGWGASLANGDPIPLRLVLDGTDTYVAPELKGVVQQVLGEYQLQSRDEMIENLPEEVFEMGKKMPESVRKQFTSAMTPWSVEADILYNPGLRFIDFVMSGIVGLILQLLTVTLMACTIARERESGTLSQLLVSPLRRLDIVLGKVLPYLAVSAVLIVITLATGHFHFHVQFRAPLALALLCFLFLLCSLGTGLIISALCQTQAQAIQFAVFYLIPIFPLSGAFAPLDSLPAGVRMIAEIFPLTHFCRAFRMVTLGHTGFAPILGDLGFLLAGAVVTCAGASLLLSRIQD